jgi:hypothetical protein
MNQMMMGGGMYDPMMMQQMGGMYDPMHSMFSSKVDDEPEAEVDSAQMMMMPMGGSCGSTCACRQQCRMIWW